MNNPPRKGKCPYCERQSVRLLDPPLVEINLDPDSLTSDLIEGDIIWWNPTSGFPSDPFEIVNASTLANSIVVALAPEAQRDVLMCWRCFDGHVWPALRPCVINMPLEIRFNPNLPWADAEWISLGREQRLFAIASL